MFPRYRHDVCFTGLILIAFLFNFAIWSLAIEPNQEQQNQHKTTNYKNLTQKSSIQVRGHIMGDTSEKVPNLTKDINTHNYHPINGSPVQIPSRQIRQMRQLFSFVNFNSLPSVNRSLPEARTINCLDKFSIDGLPQTSIIIVFREETWYTLRRTIYSIVNRSPPELLREIILVDDATQKEILKKPLDYFVANIAAPIRILRSQERIGLAKARMLGARNATGKVLTFLDGDCECTNGWLEPLLSRIEEDRKIVVCPTNDIINEDTMAYVRGFDYHWGAFNWGMKFRWYAVGRKELEKRKKDITEPFMTPVMASGLFAMEREYFFELGGFDEALEISDAQKLEISFRSWMCGGTVEIAPCSHVVHVSRESHTSPYSFSNGVTRVHYDNMARVAMVWMDDWKEFYFKFNKEAGKIRSSLDVHERQNLRFNLNCHTFRWYLNNIWPQNFFPLSDRYFGKIRHMPSGECIQTPPMPINGGQSTGVPTLKQCIQPPSLKQMFIMTPEGFIMSDEYLCLDTTAKVNKGQIDYVLRMFTCTGTPKQKWKRIAKKNMLVHLVSAKCLEHSEERTVPLILKNCDNNIDQQWEFDSVSWI